MGIVTTWLFAGATFAFVLGLVLGRHGGRVRHAALVLFVLALLPSVVLGALHAVGAGLQIHPLALIIGCLLLSVGAYAVLRLRTTTPAGPKRVQMKRPYTHRGDNALIEFLRREMDRDA
jgi:hypothetical protein